jgi:hypothetical protein
MPKAEESEGPGLLGERLVRERHQRTRWGHRESEGTGCSTFAYSKPSIESKLSMDFNKTQETPPEERGGLGVDRQVVPLDGVKPETHTSAQRGGKHFY